MPENFTQTISDLQYCPMKSGKELALIQGEKTAEGSRESYAMPLPDIFAALMLGALTIFIIHQLHKRM